MRRATALVMAQVYFNFIGLAVFLPVFILENYANVPLLQAAMDILEISGAGVRFCTPDILPMEQYVETVIVLSRFPLRLAGAVGRIIRQDRQDDKTVYALDFTRIRERDLELIVQFVFQSQRDDLRVKKWD